MKSKLLSELGEIQHRTASEQIEQVLKQAILEGRLPPGEVLRQEDLAQTFNVSRMPVREALMRISEHRDRPFRLIVTGHFANA